MTAEAKVPTVISVGVICLALGAGGAVATMHFLGYQKQKPAGADAGGAPAAAPTAMGMPGGGPPGGMMGGAPGGPPGGMTGMGSASKGGMGGGASKGGKGGGPNPKNQLASLVTKLDLVTGKPPVVQLSDEQKKKVQEQLKGLEAADQLNDDDAKKRLDTLLEIVKDHRTTLELVGYRWPSQGGPGGFSPPPDVPNPFREEKSGKPLKSLQERMGQK